MICSRGQATADQFHHHKYAVIVIPCSKASLCVSMHLFMSVAGLMCFLGILLRGYALGKKWRVEESVAGARKLYNNVM